MAANATYKKHLNSLLLQQVKEFKEHGDMDIIGKRGRRKISQGREKRCGGEDWCLVQKKHTR